MMAFSGRGQTSWQTMQAWRSPQAMQREISMDAQPMMADCFCSRLSLGIAPVGQIWPQALQEYSH